MKRILALFAVFVLIIACTFAALDAKADAAPDDTPTCTVQLLNIVCVEAGVTVLNQPVVLPTVRVTLPPVTVPVPGPTRTRTVEVNVPGPTKTVQGPVSTQTITQPAEVVTKTVRPSAGPTALPTATVTTTATVSSVETVTATPRQPPPTSGTVDPGGDGLVPRDEPPALVAGIGLGILLLMVVLILLGMYGGYYIGYRDSDKAEANFFRALLNNK